VWSAPYDEGHVVYFGWDWRTSTWNAPKDGSAWSAVLQATLAVQVQHQPPDQRAEPEPEPADLCATVSCGSRGRCDGSTGQCACDSGWRGDDCARPPADPCAGVICGSHGRCLADTGACHCDLGFIGDHCQNHAGGGAFGVVGGSWPQVTWLGRGGAAAAAGAMMVAGSVHVRRRATAVAEARREMTQPLATAV
jgi:hypothetical protein